MKVKVHGIVMWIIVMISFWGCVEPTCEGSKDVLLSDGYYKPDKKIVAPLVKINIDSLDILKTYRLEYPSDSLTYDYFEFAVNRVNPLLLVMSGQDMYDSFVLIYRINNITDQQEVYDRKNGKFIGIDTEEGRKIIERFTTIQK